MASTLAGFIKLLQKVTIQVELYDNVLELLLRKDSNNFRGKTTIMYITSFSPVLFKLLEQIYTFIFQ